MIIEESGVEFGDFNPNDFFHIEKSAYLVHTENIKRCEFIWLNRNKNTLFFVEAKSSAPDPTKKEDFDIYIAKIVSKFSNSVQLFAFGALGKIQQLDDEIPDGIKSVDWASVRCKLLLIIPTYCDEKAKWLPPLAEVIRKEMKVQRKLWDIPYSDIVVVNMKQARQYNLLR